MDVSSNTVTENRLIPMSNEGSTESDRFRERQLARWGGTAGLGGVVLMLLAFGVVIGLELPDASDPETLTDFADIEAGRIASTSSTSAR